MERKKKKVKKMKNSNVVESYDVPVLKGILIPDENDKVVEFGISRVGD